MEGKVLALQWQDNSSVHFLSTIHSLEDRIVSERKKPQISSGNGPAIPRSFGSHERVKVSIPVITNDYNRYKVGVDVADQYSSYYFTQLKCLWNWPPILFWLLDTTVSVRSRPGPPWGPAGGLPRARDETGRQDVVRPRLSFLLVGQL